MHITISIIIILTISSMIRVTYDMIAMMTLVVTMMQVQVLVCSGLAAMDLL